MNVRIPKRSLNFRSLAPSIVVWIAFGAVTWGGCLDGDESDEIVIRDAGAGCGAGAESLASPIAEAALIDLELSSSIYREVSVEAAELSDPSVLRVESASNPLTLRALSPGTSELSVSTSHGGYVAVPLSVAAVARRELVHADYTIWNFDADFAVPHPDATEEMLAPGVSMLPGSLLDLQGRYYDSAGTRLLGYGLAEWQSDGVDLAVVNVRAEMARVTAPDRVGSATVSIGDAPEYEVALIDPASVASVAAYLPSTGDLVEGISLAPGEMLTVVLIAFDGDGRTVVGVGPDGFVHEIGDQAIASAATPLADLTEDDISASDRAMLAQSRVLILEGVSAGRTTLTLGVAAHSIELPVVVE